MIPEPAKMQRVCLIGLGLMGGSLGLALRQRGLAAHVVGCGREALLRRAIEADRIQSLIFFGPPGTGKTRRRVISFFYVRRLRPASD